MVHASLRLPGAVVSLALEGDKRASGAPDKGSQDASMTQNVSIQLIKGKCASSIHLRELELFSRLFTSFNKHQL